MQLHREDAAIRSRGASLSLVGIGSAAFIRGFREETGVTSPIFADPTFATYRALGMKRGWRTFLSAGFVRNALRALRSGHRNRGIAGDYLQHGGVLVVRPGGIVAYRYASATAGDHAPVSAILQSL